MQHDCFGAISSLLLLQLQSLHSHCKFRPLPGTSCPRGLAVVVYLLSFVRLFVIPWTLACQAPLSMGFPNPGVCCHFLLQGIFPTQALNLSLGHCRQTLYHLIPGDSSVSERGGKEGVGREGDERRERKRKKEKENLRHRQHSHLPGCYN